MLNDPDIVKALTDAGMAAMLLQLQQQVDTLAANAPRGPSRKPPTEEDMEWGMFIQNYGENPQPDMVPEYFRYVLRGGTTGSTELPTAAAVFALVRSRPHWADEWRQEFPELFKKAEQWMQADPNRAGWNDFYMVQWFVLRDDQIVGVLKGRAEIPGPVGDTCKWMLNSVSQQMPAFAEALERVGYDGPMASVPHPADNAIAVQLDKFVGSPITVARANELNNRTYITFETPTMGVQLSADLLAVSFRDKEQS
jgi:hypothetical protein